MADQNPDDQIDHTDVRDEPMDGVEAHRGRAAAEIDQIARDAKEALADQGIDIDLFFLAPNSGKAILIYGTAGNPPNDEWDRVGEIVGSIVARLIGLDRVRCQEVLCMTTADLCQPSAADGATNHEIS